jgi:pilus assembly protein FimV
MALDKNKIIAEATKLVQRGSYDKAIGTYQRILSEDAKDVRVLLKVGELYQKKGDEKLAADAFTRVAETYAEQGFFLKAVAVYKQIVKLAPEDVRVNERLAALYQQLGLMSDAMGQLQFMAAAHEKAGDTGRLTDVLQRMVELDPENIASSIKLGELHARAGRNEPALECLRRAADYLKKHSRTDEYLKVAERIASLRGEDVGLTKELANIYLAKGDTKRALAKLQLCFKSDPKDVDTLHLLAQAFRDLGQTAKTLSVYKELAHVHAEQGRHAEARTTWRKVQELAPDDPDATAALGPATPPPAAARPSAPPPGPPPGAVRPPASAPPPPPPPRPGGPIAPPVGSDTIQKLLTETDVYVKYGLHDKALDHLRKVLTVDPQSPEAHERSREIHLAAGRPSEAGDAGAAAIRAFLARGQQPRARDALLRLRQIDPGNPAILELGSAVGGTEELEVVEELIEPADLALDPSAARPARPEEDELAIQAAGDEVEEVVEEEEPPPQTAELVLEEGVALEVGEPDPDLSADAAPAGEEREPEVVEVVEVDQAAPVMILGPPPPAPPAAAAPPAPVVAAPPPPAPAPRPAPAPIIAAPPPPAPPPPPAEEQAEEAEADLTDELEEASFFLQQGLLDEAREALRNLLEFYPDHPGVTAKLAEVERRAAVERGGPQAPPAGAAAPGAEEGLDIARDLAEALDAAPAPAAAEDEFQYSVEDVFSQFKKGVEATVRPEDSATHYDLGIAYREMGLLDDAIHEFETALKGNERRREVDCLTMIGICRMARGAVREAIQAYRSALGSEFLTRDAAKALHLELGAAYEAAGQPEAALHHLQKVVRADPGYRDAAARVRALGGGPGRPPADADPHPAAAPRPPNGAAARPAAAPARPPAPARAAPPPAAPPAGKKNIGYL